MKRRYDSLKGAGFDPADSYFSENPRLLLMDVDLELAIECKELYNQKVEITLGLGYRQNKLTPHRPTQEDIERTAKIIDSIRNR